MSPDIAKCPLRGNIILQVSCQLPRSLDRLLIIRATRGWTWHKTVSSCSPRKINVQAQGLVWHNWDKNAVLNGNQQCNFLQSLLPLAQHSWHLSLLVNPRPPPSHLEHSKGRIHIPITVTSPGILFMVSAEWIFSTTEISSELPAIKPSVDKIPQNTLHEFV